MLSSQIARQSNVICSYSRNGKKLFELSGKDLTSFSYTDKASGESDSLSIECADRNRQWLSSKMPYKGDKIQAFLLLTSGTSTKNFKCGDFTLDTFSISGEPLKISLSGLSSPAATSFSVTARSKVWENVTIKQIASDIAKRAGISLFYDADSILITTVEQSNQTDGAFLLSLCNDFGICMKAYSEKIVLYSMQKAITEKAVKTVGFRKTSAGILQILPGWSFDSSLDGLYTGVQLSYEDTNGKTINYKTGKSTRLLKITEKKPANLAEAERMAKAALLNANIKENVLSFSLMGNTDIVAGQNINITGIGELIDGKYFIASAEHKISGGYTTSYEAYRIDNL